MRDRCEYRVFGSDLRGIIAQQLSLWGRLLGEESSSETYIIARFNIEANLKIRGGILELKALKARIGQLELWHPVLSEALPIPSNLFTERIAPVLGVSIEIDPSGPLDSEMIVELARAHPQLEPMVVGKKRRKYELKDGYAEIVQVSVGKTNVHSVAVESDDARSVLRLVETVGIAGRNNVSYPSFLNALAFG